MGKLSGKVALVTGASRGLGRAIALAYAAEGAALVICARGEAALRQVEAELRGQGADVLAVQADVAVAADVERLVSLAEARLGRIDVLVNNAAVLGPSPMPYLIDYPAEDFAEVLRVNALGPFLVTRRVLAGMLQRGSGVIINVTSDAGRVGYEGWGAYGVSKFALEGLTQTWAAELAGTGVRVNLVDPGDLDTQMHHLAAPEETDLTDPAAVAPVFVWLASDEAADVHGRRIEARSLAS